MKQCITAMIFWVILVVNAQQSTVRLDLLLNSLEIRENKHYQVSRQVVQVTEHLDFNHLFYQSVMAYQSFNNIKKFQTYGFLPTSIQEGFDKEIGFQKARCDSNIRKIDRALAMFWIHEFDQNNVLNYNLITTNHTEVPMLYNRSMIIDVLDYVYPSHSLDFFVSLKLDNLAQVSADFHNEKYKIYQYDQKIQINNVFSNRYRTLHSICLNNGAKLHTDLAILFPARDNENIILGNLITSLGLKKHKDQSLCIIAALMYVQILEQDLDRILHDKLTDTEHHLTLQIPNLHTLRLLMPYDAGVPVKELSSKVYRAYPKIRLRKKRNIFLSLFGAASESDRLQNSLALKDMEQVNNDLRNAQITIQGELKRVLGSRQGENQVLTDIGDHVEFLERSAKIITKQIRNSSQVANNALHYTNAHMIANLGLQIGITELDLITESIDKMTHKLEQAIIHNQVDFVGTHYIFASQTLDNIKIYPNKKGIVISARYGFQPEIWRSLNIKTLPIETKRGPYKLQLPEFLITNGVHKLDANDLFLCDHANKQCPADVALQSLNNCEKFVFRELKVIQVNKPSLTTMSQESIAKDCAKLLTKTQPGVLQYIHVNGGLLLYSTIPGIGYKVCRSTTSRLDIPIGHIKIGLQPECYLKVHDYIIKGLVRNFKIEGNNFDFIDNDLATVITDLLDQYNVTTYDMNITNVVKPGTNVSDRIADFANRNDDYIDSISYNDDYWYRHHTLLYSHVGTSVLIGLVLTGIITCGTILCCKRQAIVKAIQERVSSPALSADRHADVSYRAAPSSPGPLSRSPSPVQEVNIIRPSIPVPLPTWNVPESNRLTSPSDVIRSPHIGIHQQLSHTNQPPDIPPHHSHGAAACSPPLPSRQRTGPSMSHHTINN